MSLMILIRSIFTTKKMCVKTLYCQNQNTIKTFVGIDTILKCWIWPFLFHEKFLKKITQKIICWTWTKNQFSIDLLNIKNINKQKIAFDGQKIFCFILTKLSEYFQLNDKKNLIFNQPFRYIKLRYRKYFLTDRKFSSPN